MARYVDSRIVEAVARTFERAAVKPSRDGLRILNWAYREETDENAKRALKTIVDNIKLAGRKYHSKRNHVNQFLRSYSFAYAPLTDDHLKECLNLTETWCEWHRCEEDMNLLDEWYQRPPLPPVAIYDFLYLLQVNLRGTFSLNHYPSFPISRHTT